MHTFPANDSSTIARCTLATAQVAECSSSANHQWSSPKQNSALSVCGHSACQDSLHAVCLEVALKTAHEGSEAPESFSFIAHDIQDGRRQVRHTLQQFQQAHLISPFTIYDNVMTCSQASLSLCSGQTHFQSTKNVATPEQVTNSNDAIVASPYYIGSSCAWDYTSLSGQAGQ